METMPTRQLSPLRLQIRTNVLKTNGAFHTCVEVLRCWQRCHRSLCHGFAEPWRIWQMIAFKAPSFPNMARSACLIFVIDVTSRAGTRTQRYPRKCEPAMNVKSPNRRLPTIGSPFLADLLWRQLARVKAWANAAGNRWQHQLVAK